LGDNQFFSGGNCLFKKAVLEELGGFPAHLGMTGAPRAYGEETHRQLELRRAGDTTGFDPQPVVEHPVSPRKMSVGALLRDHFAAGRDSWRTFGREPTSVRKLAQAAAAVKTACTHLPGALWRLRGSDYYLQNAVLDIAGPAAYTLGQLFDR